METVAKEILTNVNRNRVKTEQLARITSIPILALAEVAFLVPIAKSTMRTVPLPHV